MNHIHKLGGTLQSSNIISDRLVERICLSHSALSRLNTYKYARGGSEKGIHFFRRLFSDDCHMGFCHNESIVGCVIGYFAKVSQVVIAKCKHMLVCVFTTYSVTITKSADFISYNTGSSLF